VSDLARDYLSLGLRMGRVVDGFVDCWFGDPELKERVDAEPAPDPADLARQAAELLVRLPDSGLDGSRTRFLLAQLTALECGAGRMAGRDMPFLAEVETCFGVRVGLGEPDAYAGIHEEISALLPGGGPLADRVAAFYDRNAVPPDRIGAAVRAVAEELRAKVHAEFPLPADERVEFEVVEGKPWNAFNRYLGGHRSAVAVNAEAGRTIAALPLIATHEAYPGHHTERCLKEAGLVTGLGQVEQTIALVNTPQCLTAEGAAELAVDVVLGPGWGEWTSEVVAGLGLRTDGELVERLLVLVQRLMPARQDAAILLHDRGASLAEAVDHLERWLLLPRDRAEHIGRFLMDPLWRAYSVTYVEGARLVRAWLAARPEGESAVDRYRVLLEQPLLPADLETC
jgi:hypothetical protein